MKKLFVLLVCLVLSVPVLADSQISEEDAGQIDSLSREIANAPRAEDYARRGQIYSKVELHDKSESDYSEALKLEKNDPGLLWRRAMERTDLKKYNEAIADCAQIKKDIDEDERNCLSYMQALRIESHCFEKLGRMDEMLNSFRELAALGDKTAVKAIERWDRDHKSKK